MFSKDTLTVTIPNRFRLGGDKVFILKTNKKKNIISINNIKSSYDYDFIEKLSNSKILIKSENYVVTCYKKAYYKKKYVDNLNYGDIIKVINNKIYTLKDSLKFNKKMDYLIKNKKKIKKIKIDILKGPKAYEKYGVIGIYGAFECFYTFKITTQNKELRIKTTK